MSNYLITGGGFNNKGAESMLYTLLTELRDKEPNCKIYVLINSKINEINKNFKNIEFISYKNKDLRRILNPFFLFFNKNQKSLIKIIKDCDIFFDISGYILSSDWGKGAKELLNRIKVAKKYKKKIILLPQSFGPFNFKNKYGLTNKNLNKVLSYADLIFAREQDGLNYLKNLSLQNIEYSPDIVIQSSKQISGFLEIAPEYSEIEIKPKSVLIIPNVRVFERTDKEQLLLLYKNSIKHLLNNEYNVYISYYDLSDKSICNEIVDMFKDSKNVTFLEKNLDCIQFSTILNKFNFVISSRFHSIVHSYRNAIPVLAIGWAIKYKELLHLVEQEQFMYDGINLIDTDKFLSSIDYLINNFKTESEKIKLNVIKIQEQNCFDKVWEYLSK